MLRKFTFYFLVSLAVIVSNAQPSNDNCGLATPVTIPGSGDTCVIGTLAGATDDGFFSACENAGSNEVWFSYIATGSSNTVTVTPIGGTPATNLVVSLMSGPCGSLTVDACEAAATANGGDTLSWVYTPGTQVWVFISSNSGSSGTFQLCISSTSPAPANTGKDCTTAVRLCDKSSFTTTIAPGNVGWAPACFTSFLSKPIVFQFTVGQTGLLNWLAVPTCGAPHAAATEFDWALYEITAGCPGVFRACNYNYTGSFSPVVPPITAPQGMQGGPGAGCVRTTATGDTLLEICPGLTVDSGKSYMIVINQYTTGNTCSIDFDFTGSTFEMTGSPTFTVSPDTGCGSVTATFNNTSSGAATYSWDFGNGTTSNLQNPPPITYSTVGTYLVSLSTTIVSGCSDVASQSVQVFPGSAVSVNSDSICPGDAATLTATPDVAGGTYLWSPGGAITQSIAVSPATTTSYTVTYTLNNCASTATAVVSVPATGNFTVNAGNDSVVCSNQTIQLNGTVSPSGAYTYQWSPSGTLTNSNTLTPLATPVANTTYTLSVSDAFGCSKADSLVVNISGSGVPVIASVTPLVVCPGDPVQLNAEVVISACGPSTLCSGNIRSGVIGTQTITQPGSNVSPPTLLGNFDRSGRNEMLYTAAELNAIFGGPCVIRTLIFNLAVHNSSAYLENFTVKMACTNVTTLNNWVNNLTTVYTSPPASPYFPQPSGWNNIVTFTTPFAWDGVSNLVIDVCWFNPVSYNNINNKAQCSNTAFNSYLYSSGFADQCPGSVPPNVSTLRPNIRFDYCIPDINDFDITWTPNTGVNTVSVDSIPNPTANPQVTTNYTISVSNGGCAGTDIVTVLVDDAQVNAGSDVNSCPGFSTTLTATMSGTIIPGPASYTWTTLSGTPVGNTQAVTVSPSVTTTYVVTLSGGTCLKHDTVTISVSGLNVIPTPVNVTCNGASDGKIFVSSDGIAPHSYAWSANAVTGNVDSAINLSPSSYSVSVTDVNGCSGSATASITEPTLLSFIYSVTDVTCFGGSDGSITVTPSGGTPGYTYLWSNSLPPDQTVDSLPAGNYLVTVSDANLCIAIDVIAVAEPTQIIFGSPTITDVRCFNGNDGSITVTASGGTGPYTYSWSHNGGLNSATATNLTAANYTVTITDSAGCSVSALYTVGQPTSGMTFSLAAIVDVTCFGGSDGSATVNPSGGTAPYQYLWSPSGQTTQTAINLSAQTYTVVVTDDSLCTASATVTVNEPPQILIAGNITNVQCFGNSDGAIDITVTNGVGTLSYLWDTGATSEDLTGISAGTYSVTVTDNTSCTASASFTVTEPAVLTLDPPTIVNVSCFGGNNGSITANPVGGTGTYNYFWSPAGSSQTVSSLIAGTYLLTASDQNGCSVTASYQVTEPPTAIAFGAAVIVDVLCNGFSTGSVTVSVSGGTPGYTYQWSHNASLNNPSAASLPAGNYRVTVTDANGCSITAGHTIIEPAAIIFGTPTIINVGCSGGNNGSATITVSGGVGPYSFAWNGVAGTNPQFNLSAGNYNVVVTDANSCVATTTITITEPAVLSVALTAHDATCYGASNGSVDATPSGGNPPYQYLWSDSQLTQTAYAVPAANYQETVTDETGCYVTAAAQVSQPSQLTFTMETTQVRCPGDRNGTITVFPSGGTAPYNYAVTQDGSNFVFTTDNVVIGLASGFYTVIVSDNNGCTRLDTAFVPAPVPDNFTYTVDSTSCYGPEYNDGGIFVNGLTFQNMPYTYGVDGGLQQYSGDFYNMTAGRHTITAINYWGCPTDIVVIVPEPVNGVADVMPQDSTIQLGESIQFFSSFTPYPVSDIVSYTWSPTLGLNCADCPNPIATPYSPLTVYTLTIVYNDHCLADASLTVLVQNDIKVFIPNTFSPNGDGNNDEWLIYGEGIKTLDLKIFNRWGEKMYESKSQFAGWDGTYKGVLQNPAVFVYEVTITYLDGRNIDRTGSITILR